MELRTAAIIPAAGLSSRMGAFKPLLEIDGEPLIRRTARSALAGGVTALYVVIGFQAPLVRAALADLPTLRFVENPLFATSDMLYSVRLALRAAGFGGEKGEGGGAGAGEGAGVGVLAGAGVSVDAVAGADEGVGVLAGATVAPNPAEGESLDALFILPGDMPAIAPESFKALARAAAATWGEPDAARLFCPSYQGACGHPLLVVREVARALVGVGGRGEGVGSSGSGAGADSGSGSAPTGGLRAALAAYIRTEIAVTDEGILLDADTPTDYERLKEYLRTRTGAEA